MSVPELQIIVAHGSDETRADLCDAISGNHRIIEECGTVAQFKQAALNNTPDLIVTGIWFPDGDGIDTAIDLGQQRPIPCVVSTAARSLDLVRKAMEDHVMAYLVEPVTKEDLDAAIIVAWSRFEQLRDLETQVEDLKTALEHRKVIERAKGLLMAQRSIPEDDAFAILRRRAQDNRIRMVDVAEEILDDHSQEPTRDDSTVLD